MAFNDIYRLRIYQTMHGAQVVNVMHFVCNDPAPVDQSLALANDFVTNLTTSLKNRAANAVAFNYVEVQKIVPFSGGPATVNFPGGTVGGVVGNSISATLAEVVTIYSERGGRRGRGRVFLPPPETSTSSAVNGQWVAAQTTRTQTWINAMMARYVTPVGSTFALGVWSRRSGPVMPPWTTDQFSRATAMIARNIIRTQRRRQVGVGR